MISIPVSWTNWPRTTEPVGVLETPTLPEGVEARDYWTETREAYVFCDEDAGIPIRLVREVRALWILNHTAACVASCWYPHVSWYDPSRAGFFLHLLERVDKSLLPPTVSGWIASTKRRLEEESRPASDFGPAFSTYRQQLESEQALLRSFGLQIPDPMD